MVRPGERKRLPFHTARAEISTTRNNNREVVMRLEGGCYCGEVRYVAEGDPMMQAQCHCRECQYISGGAPNTFIAMPAAGFSYITGQPKQFARKDLERAVTREFCAQCGTHLVTKVPGLPAAILKVGTLDELRSSIRRWRSTPATSRTSTRSPRAWRHSRSCRGIRAPIRQSRHKPSCPGLSRHPRSWTPSERPWVAGTGPAMTSPRRPPPRNGMTSSESRPWPHYSCSGPRRRPMVNRVLTSPYLW